MKKVSLFAIALFAGITAFGQTWTLDKSHAKLGFTISHLMVSDVDGLFKSFDIKLSATQADFSDATIELSADINSINTDNEQRDAHLKNADFFDAPKYPTLNFKSTSFKKVSGKTYKLTGNLTMHGVTKPVSLDVTFNGTAVHPYNKKTVAGFKITGTLKRTDFNISTSTPSAMVGDEVAIVANAEFMKD